MPEKRAVTAHLPDRGGPNRPAATSSSSQASVRTSSGRFETHHRDDSRRINCKSAEVGGITSHLDARRLTLLAVRLVLCNRGKRWVTASLSG